MSQITGHDRGHDTVSSAAEKSWEKPAAADDIVDPIDRTANAESMRADDLKAGRDQSLEDEEDVPLDVKLTDALSMLADGGHDYGSRPVIDEELDDATSGAESEIDLGEIDESSKDA